MNMIRNKLREKSGVSILMGLLFLLVCLFVGTVALTASTAAAGKLAEQQEREQDYLNVASAARLVKDRICKLTYTYTKSGETLGSGTLTTSDASTNNKVILEKELEELCRILMESPGSAPEKSFKIDLSSNSSGVTWETVYGSLSVKEDGRIIVELWLGNEQKDNEDNHNRMEIEFCPDGPVKKTVVNTKESDTGEITKTSITTTTYSWPESGCTITKGKQ